VDGDGAPFKPGHSGNPEGRPKGTKNLKTDLMEELSERISISEGGKPKKLSKQRALLKSLAAKAIKGDARAMNISSVRAMSEPAWKQNARARAILLDTVFARPDLTALAKCVFAVLIGHLDLTTMQCNPGKPRLAVKLGMSSRTVQRGLAELLDAGAVTRKLTKTSPLYSFPHLSTGETTLSPLNGSRGDRSGHSSGDRSGHSSGDNPVSRTLEPIEPSKRHSGKEAKSPAPITEAERAANVARMDELLTRLKKAKRA
jgi:Family of unknown function (DUF5681)/Helix-turn-helix domain